MKLMKFDLVITFGNKRSSLFSRIILKLDTVVYLKTLILVKKRASLFIPVLIFFSFTKLDVVNAFPLLEDLRLWTSLSRIR